MNRKRKLSSVLAEEELNSPSNSEQPNGDLPGNYSSIAQRMMAKMGHKKGKGLGKHESGRVNIIEASNQRGRRGLGLRLEGLEAKPDASWDIKEEIIVRQDPDWVPKNLLELPSTEELSQWIVMAERKEEIADEFDFVEPEILNKILESKNVFDNLGQREFLKARTLANPYETIRGGIFQNRAAMKMAEIDASFDFIFTKHSDRNANNPSDLLYFADICAGPGGFSEYIFWRGKWQAKGFGMTIKASWANDFKLEDYIAGTPETFDCFYGKGGYDGDGDIFKEENLTEFRNYVLENSDNKGLHFVMADGGFSVEGKENIQEILSKQLYLCQFLCALSVLRIGGHFVCKVFDLFTPFSVGLVYLMYRSFEQISIFKPVTSRPANSERYLICKTLCKGTDVIHDYMFDINKRINNLKGSNIDIREIVPISLMNHDKQFFSYVFQTNNVIGARQILGLQKLATFVQNINLVGPNQAEVRKQCLNAWNVPLDARSSPPKNDPDVQFEKLMKNDTIEWMSKGNANIELKTLKRIKSIHDYKFAISGGERVFLFSLGRHVIFQWNPSKDSYPQWRRVDKLSLELPRFTMIDVEFVFELKGEGRGQRKLLAVHILDAAYLGNEYVGDKPFSERIKYCESFVKALTKPCRNDIVSIRVKTYYQFSDVGDVLDNFEIKHMKPRMEEKLSCSVSKERYFVPIGLYFVRRLRDPWHLQYSKSNKRLYFYNSTTNESCFEGVKESIANINYCTETRLFWKWSEYFGLNLESGKDNELSKSDFLAFIKSVT